MTGTNDSDVVRRERFSGGPARSFLSSLDADVRIFQADLAVDRAHVVMLAEQDIVTDTEAATILQALDVVEVEEHAGLPEGEDIHAAIETSVIDQVGPVGGKMHTARSRNDEVATCIRYRLREDLADAIEATLACREALLEVATEHTETVMPGYTHLQPAQPTTVAHWACSYQQALARDTARLFDAYARVDQSPLGAAAFAGTTFDIDRERVAELLGFDGVLDNATDASATRDFLVETAAALATLATTLSGLAEDVLVFANKGLVDLADDYSSTSSIMPQKVNPDTLELVRGTAGDASAGLNGLLTTLKGLPRAYNRDLQRATPHIWASVDAVTEATAVAAGAVATADWPEAELEAAAGEGFSTATGVADLLAASGIPFRTAHEVLALAAEAAEEGGTPSFDLVAAAAEEVLDEPLSTYVSEAAVKTALDPVSNVAARDSLGGPAPETVAEHLDTVSEGLADDETALEDLVAAVGDANDELRAEVTAYV
ncbi:argininosuccinate lyase [Halomarina oriensis]|uniref:Argininosuccinate lyase n=1 Tax=Halomarina oriensis TaxID=671145 RepID=A0A6B0GRN7_9EURY|nr:argininosuccinate lyase [Halomarina oriensis]MWG34338.1 argininosuccinate lyase [Halomarina oriensis]